MKRLTVLEDALHVEAVGSTGLIICAPLQVVGQFAGAGVIDDTRVSCTDSICEWSRRDKEILKLKLDGILTVIISVLRKLFNQI